MTTTSAPRAANVLADAPPMTPPPPVTNATRPVKSKNWCAIVVTSDSSWRIVRQQRGHLDAKGGARTPQARANHSHVLWGQWSTIGAAACATPTRQAKPSQAKAGNPEGETATGNRAPHSPYVRRTRLPSACGLLARRTFSIRPAVHEAVGADRSRAGGRRPVVAVAWRHGPRGADVFARRLGGRVPGSSPALDFHVVDGSGDKALDGAPNASVFMEAVLESRDE